MKFAHFAEPFKRTGETVKQRHEMLCRELALCDELGFDYAFIAEQHFTQVIPNPAVYCAYAAAHTRRIRVGPMGFVVPFYDPLQLFEQAALCDTMLDGRFELGLVPGIVPRHFHIFGADWENRRSLVNEALALIKSASGKESGFSFNGPHHKYEDIKMQLSMIQKPHPPVWIMSRTPEELQLLAREGVHTGYLFFSSRTEAAGLYREYLDNWRKAGHSHKPNVCYVTLGYVDETDELAIKRARPHIVESNLAIFAGAHRSKDALADVFMKRGEKVAADVARNMDNPDWLLKEGHVFIGSPKTVTEQIKAAAVEGCFNTLFIEFNIGSIPEADLMRSIRLFGTQVLPALREFEPREFKR